MIYPPPGAMNPVVYTVRLRHTTGEAREGKPGSRSRKPQRQAPLTFEERRENYCWQLGTVQPTRRQLRRLTHKRHHAEAQRGRHRETLLAGLR